jgi:hypothetical protein
MKRPKNYNRRTQTISGWLADALQNREKKRVLENKIKINESNTFMKGIQMGIYLRLSNQQI